MPDPERVEAIHNVGAIRSGRTADEVAHELALPLVDDLVFGEAIAVVVVSTKGRTAFRFVHVTDRALQIQTLRECADVLEGKNGQLDVPV